MSRDSILRFKALLFKKSTFAAADQILLSVSNFALAFYILKLSDAHDFGIYSFLIVVCQLLHGFWASILHGQMTLRIASARRKVKNSIYLQTILLYLSLFVIASVLIVSVLKFGFTSLYEEYKQEIIGALLYIFVFSIYDLSKKFLYVLGLQNRSFYYSFIYTLVLLFGLILSSFFIGAQHTVLAAFLVNVSAFLVAIVVNKECLYSLRVAKKMTTSLRYRLLLAYLEQGRFGAMGMMVTWCQNQSITPILMFFSGPAVVGYFNIARLIVMPVMVVNTGFIASALPELRSKYKRMHSGNLLSVVTKYSFINIGFSMLYFVVITILHFTGVLDILIPEYSNASDFLIIWGGVCLVLTYRAWLAQLFIVSMQFKYLLSTGIVATVITLISMVLGYQFFNSYYVMPFGILLGDIYLIATFLHQFRNGHFTRQ